MSIWIITQILFFLILSAGVGLLWARALREPKDDPRLSRGLQLLQSKISVLEDLSDRTELQVGQLTALLQQKVLDIQSRLEEADKQVARINYAIEKSLEVAQIFQDKIPHREIIERQNTINYVRAAQMAHRGCCMEEIAKEIDLPVSELEMIVKLNRDQLMFNEESLPEWITHNTETRETSSQDVLLKDSFVQSDLAQHSVLQNDLKTQRHYGDVFDVPVSENSSLKRLDEEFRKACREQEGRQNSTSIVDNIFATLKANGLFIDEQKENQESNSKKSAVDSATSTKNTGLDYASLVDETFAKSDGVSNSENVKVQTPQGQSTTKIQGAPTSTDVSMAVPVSAKNTVKPVNVRAVEFKKIEKRNVV